MTTELRSAWTGTQEQFMHALPTLLANYQQKRMFEQLDERQREMARLVKSWM